MAKYDWEAIEKDYRLGQLSVRAIADKYNMKAHSLIDKKAKKNGWTRNVAKQVYELTRNGLVAGVNKSEQQVNTPTREDIEAAALTNIQVISRHRSDIRKGRELVFMLMGQLSDAATNRNEIEGTILEETEEDEGVARRNSMLKAISLPAHAGTLRDLTTALKNLVPLERQAYNIRDDDDGAKTFEDHLKDIARGVQQDV